MKILAQGSSSLDKMIKGASPMAPISKSTVARIIADVEVAAGGVVERLEEIEETGDVTGLGEDAAKVLRLWIRSKALFDAWADPEYKGCCQEAMNSHY